MLEIVAKEATAVAGAGVGPGWHVESIDGRVVESFADIAEAAGNSNGAPLSVVWRGPSADDGGAGAAPATTPTTTLVTTVEPRPEF